MSALAGLPCERCGGRMLFERATLVEDRDEWRCITCGHAGRPTAEQLAALERERESFETVGKPGDERARQRRRRPSHGRVTL